MVCLLRWRHFVETSSTSLQYTISTDRLEDVYGANQALAYGPLAIDLFALANRADVFCCERWVVITHIGQWTCGIIL